MTTARRPITPSKAPARVRASGSAGSPRGGGGTRGSVTKSETFRRLSDALVDRLRQEIRAGAIPPGTRLRQVEVAARFNVSTTPIREAFAILEQEGLLVSSPHRGVVVFEPTVDDLAHLYEIRIPLETLETQMATEHITEPELQELEAVVAEMRRSIDKPDRYRRLHDRLHEIIGEASRRPRLAKLTGELRRESAAYGYLLSTTVSRSRSQDDYEAIADAMRAKDTARVAQIVNHYLNTILDYVAQELDSREASGSTSPDGARDGAATIGTDLASGSVGIGVTASETPGKSR